MKNCIKKVVTKKLCLGCGACEAVCPQNALTMIQDPIIGNYPKINKGKCNDCGICLKICPGINCPERKLFNYDLCFGSFYGVKIGHAVEQKVRFNGASGGVISALAIYLLESGYIDGTIMVRMHPKNGITNNVFIAHSKNDVLSGQGSRYSPASVCRLLKDTSRDTKKYAIIGKPCDIQALKNVMSYKDFYKNIISPNIILSIGLFCAQTPILQATLDFLHLNGIKETEIRQLQYRGEGWPGAMSVILGDGRRKMFPYTHFWNNHIGREQCCVQRCLLCPDGTAEWADISVGDPWNLGFDGEYYGNSLVIVRTNIGKEVFDNSIKGGYITGHDVTPTSLYQSQTSLVAKRRSIWPRLLIWKLLCKSTPNLSAFSLYKIWKNQPLLKKAKSIVGAFRLYLKVQTTYFKLLWFN